MAAYEINFQQKTLTRHYYYSAVHYVEGCSAVSRGEAICPPPIAFGCGRAAPDRMRLKRRRVQTGQNRKSGQTKQTADRRIAAYRVT